jgi:hypothetical protein
VRKMGIVSEIESTLRVPRLTLAILAIIFGVLILLIPQIFIILVAVFLIVWGIMEVLKTGKPANPLSRA